MKRLLKLLRQNWLYFSIVTLAALALRLFFVWRYPHLSGDSFIYGDIAKHWLNNGIYAVTDNGLPRPTLIRLPGYPAFLAVIFKIFGMEHYRAVMIVQAFIDTNTCLVIAALALELMNERAAKAAYLLAAICPFTANYVAAPLSETLAIFCTAHCLYYGVRGLKALNAGEPAGRLWCIAGTWAGAGLLIRPDGGIIVAAFGLALISLLFGSISKQRVIAAGLLFSLFSLAPLVPWTIRNWRTFHLVQPLAPRYANDPGEFVPSGFNHWVRTWIVDYVSVEDIYWHVPGEDISINDLPERAFDSRLSYERTEKVFHEYNEQLSVDADLDHEFENLALRRMSHNPFRYYVWLPWLRMADMWLRPRTEMLPVDSRWWEFSNHRGQSLFALIWAGINLAFLLLAWRGWSHGKFGTAGIALVSFLLLRTLFLSTLENPEPRYTLECFPVVLALAGGAFARLSTKTPPPGALKSK
jgi:hypothetical protein